MCVFSIKYILLWQSLFNYLENYNQQNFLIQNQSLQWQLAIGKNILVQFYWK